MPLQLTAEAERLAVAAQRQEPAQGQGYGPIHRRAANMGRQASQPTQRDFQRPALADFGSRSVSAINGATEAVTTLPVGAGPLASAANPVTDQIYICNDSDGTVSVINGATNLATTLPVTATPQGIAINTVSNKIYVADNGSNSLTIIDGFSNAMLALDAGTGPIAVGVDPVTGNACFANYGSASVTVVNEVPVVDTRLWSIIDTIPTMPQMQPSPRLPEGRSTAR